MSTQKEKTCISCDEEKPLTAFRKAAENPDGRINKCKACQKKEYDQQKLMEAEYAKDYFTF
jgi:hypothetical protein